MQKEMLDSINEAMDLTLSGTVCKYNIMRLLGSKIRCKILSTVGQSTGQFINSSRTGDHQGVSGHPL